MTLYLTKSGLFLSFDQISGENHSDVLNKNLEKITKIFTISNYQKETKKYILYKKLKIDKIKKRLILPRFALLRLQSLNLPEFKVINQISKGEQLTNVEWTGKLTHNQEIVSSYIMNNIYTENNSVNGFSGLILNMEAGQGKSYLACYLISVLKLKTAIILHSTSLIKQWSDVITGSLSNVSVGYYYAKKKMLGDVMLIIINSAIKNEFTIDGETITAIDFYNKFGFIIYDECHEYSNIDNGSIFKRAQSTYVLGLSATPDERTDGLDKYVSWELGNILVANKLLNYQQILNTFTATVYQICYYGSPEYTKHLVNKYSGSVSASETINMICEDKKRSELIIECIKKCLEKNLYTFVFADRREYLLQLIEMIKIKKTVNNSEVDILTSDLDYIRIVGGSTENELKNACNTAKVIFTTYKYMGTGKSIIKMNGLVLATPRRSKMKQYINRIFRLGSDQTIKRYIYDIVDMRIGLKGQFSSRKKHYTENNYEIIKKEIYYNQEINLS